MRSRVLADISDEATNKFLKVIHLNLQCIHLGFQKLSSLCKTNSRFHHNFNLIYLINLNSNLYL